MTRQGWTSHTLDRGKGRLNAALVRRQLVFDPDLHQMDELQRVDEKEEEHEKQLCHWCQAVGNNEIKKFEGVFCDTQCQAECTWADRFPWAKCPPLPGDTSPCAYPGLPVPEYTTVPGYKEWIIMKKTLKLAVYLKPGCYTFEEKLIGFDIGSTAIWIRETPKSPAYISTAGILMYAKTNAERMNELLDIEDAVYALDRDDLKRFEEQQEANANHTAELKKFAASSDSRAARVCGYYR